MKLSEPNQPDRLPCPVPGCKRKRLVDHVMCSNHWYRVPVDQRRRLWKLYLNARGSDQHRAAVADAVASVERLTQPNGAAT